jgi:hypothetical protein
VGLKLVVGRRYDLFFLPMHLRRDFQAQAVQADEAGGVVLIVGLGRVGFHRGNHIFSVALLTPFSFVWPWLVDSPSTRRENQSRVSPGRAVAAAGREYPSRAATLR